MELAGEFRREAERCLRLATDSANLHGRAYWVSMAQLWHNLATHIESEPFSSSAALDQPGADAAKPD